MSALKRVLFSVLIAQSVFLAIDAAERRSTKPTPKQALSRRPFSPILEVIKEDPCPRAPFLRGKENYFSPIIDDLVLPPVEELVILPDMAEDKQFLTNSTILSTVQQYNCSSVAPAFSLRTCGTDSSGRCYYATPKQAVAAKKRIEERKRETIQRCDCPDTKNLSTKFYHLLPPMSVTLCGQQLDDRFFAKGGGTCFEQLGAYMRQQARKSASTEQKS